MTDIDLALRRRIWPWVVALLVLAAVAWGLLELFRDRDRPVRVGAGGPEPVPALLPRPAAAA